MTARLTSREFNRDVGGAKRAAHQGPVYITDRGRPSHVLMTYADYRRLAASGPSIVELLAEPSGVDGADIELPSPRTLATPAWFE